MHPAFRTTLQRLWQPARPAFWLMLAFNGLSSALVWFVHLADPVDWLRVALAMIALANVALGAWMMFILWRDSAAPPTGDSHVQGTADQQIR